MLFGNVWDITFRKIMVGLSHLALPPLPFILPNSLLIYFYLKSWHIELYYSFWSLLLSWVTQVSQLVNQHFSEFLNSNDFHFSSILGIDSHGHTRRNVNIRNIGKNISLVAIHCFLPHPLICILLVQFYISFHSFFSLGDPRWFVLVVLCLENAYGNKVLLSPQNSNCFRLSCDGPITFSHRIFVEDWQRPLVFLIGCD